MIKWFFNSSIFSVGFIVQNSKFNILLEILIYFIYFRNFYLNIRFDEIMNSIIFTRYPQFKKFFVL